MQELSTKLLHNGYVFDIHYTNKEKQMITQLSHVNNNTQEISEEFLQFYNIRLNCSCSSQTAKIIPHIYANILDLCILFNYQHISQQIMTRFTSIVCEHPNLTYELLFIKQDEMLIKTYQKVCPYTTKQLFQCIKYFPQAEDLIDDIHNFYEEQYKLQFYFKAQQDQLLIEKKNLEQFSDNNLSNNDSIDQIQGKFQLLSTEYQTLRSITPQLQLVPPPRDENYNTPLIAAAIAGAVNLISKFIVYANCSNYEFKKACHYIDVNDISAIKLLDVEVSERNNINSPLSNTYEHRETRQRENELQSSTLIENTKNSNPYQNMFRELMAQGYFDDIVNLKHNTIEKQGDEIQSNILKQISDYDEQFNTILAQFPNCQKVIYNAQTNPIKSQFNNQEAVSEEITSSQYSSESEKLSNENQIDIQKFKNWVKTNIYAYQEKQIYFSPLMYAAAKNNEKLVKVLVDDFLGSSCPLTGVTALLIAIRCGHWDIAEKYLLPEKEIFTKLSVTPFVGSIAGGSYEFAKKHFWEQRDLPDVNGMYPLSQAVNSNNYVAFDELFYQYKYEYKYNRYSLFLSAQSGYDYFAFKLLEYQVHCHDSRKCTALHYVVHAYTDSQNYINILKMVLPFTASKYDKNGYTALSHAIQKGQCQNLIELLASYEAGIKYKYIQNYAILQSALMGHLESFQLLYPIEKRFYKQKYELLYIAIQNNYQDIINYLVNEQNYLYQIYSSGENILQKLVAIQDIPEIYLNKLFHPNYIISAYITALRNKQYSLAQKLIKMLQKSLNYEHSRLLLNRVDQYDE